eukprot:scaffold1639_cov331-Pavlova_lutheri.AAC.4
MALQGLVQVQFNSTVVASLSWKTRNIPDRPIAFYDYRRSERGGIQEFTTTAISSIVHKATHDENIDGLKMNYHSFGARFAYGLPCVSTSPMVQ